MGSVGGAVNDYANQKCVCGDHQVGQGEMCVCVCGGAGREHGG